MDYPETDPAWLAADAAFDADEDPATGDELARALLAAAPFHRADELDERIDELEREKSLLPGWRNTGRREGIQIALRILVARRAVLFPERAESDLAVPRVEHEA